jgi:N-acetylmuramoyl-L-alanine amidase
MFGFKSLFRKFLASINKFSKKAYTNGLIVLSGCIVTVLLLGTFGFVQSSQIDGKKDEIAHEDELDLAEPEMVEIAIDNEDLLESANDEFIETADIVEAASINNEEQLELVMEKDYEEAVFSTSSNQILAELDSMILTEKDYLSLVRIVEAEATGEDMIGKILVANVVLNRVESDGFPESIYDVVHENDGGYYQFSPLSDGRYYTVSITDSTYEAVERALAGEDYSEGALFFVARQLASEGAVNWFDENLVKVVQHGVHEFYTY